MEQALKKYFPIFVLPTLLAFLIAFFVPFIVGFLLSFTEFTTITDATWVGLNNYQRVFTEREGFVSAGLFTIAVAIVSIITVNIIAFALAWTLTR